MQLCIDSDDAYLVMLGAKNYIAGHFYLASTANLLNYNDTLNNVPVHTECIVLKHVVCSAAEAKCARLFHNYQTAMAMCYILAALGHHQNTIRVKTDNKTANSFVHATMHVKQSKSWDAKYHWLHEATVRNAIEFFWTREPAMMQIITQRVTKFKGLSIF
eukprot:2964247-Ditylum_brightwellii.AAC.1